MWGRGREAHQTPQVSQPIGVQCGWQGTHQAAEMHPTEVAPGVTEEDKALGRYL